MRRKKPDVTIVGAGAVGSALATSLFQSGYDIISIVSRNKGRAANLAAAIGSPFAFSLDDDVPPYSTLTFLCVPDDAITPTAMLLSRQNSWYNKTVAHVSGALTSSALHPLAEKGAFVMSFHPMQTFSNTSHASFSDIFIGMEGDDEALEMGRMLADDLDAHALVLSADMKVRYHLAASVASNYFVTLMGMAVDILESIGLERNEATALLRPLVTQTCTNVTSSTPEAALTGPAVRGDLNTLKLHQEALQKHLPSYSPLYHTLLTKTLEIAVNSGRLTEKQSKNILNAL